MFDWIVAVIMVLGGMGGLIFGGDTLVRGASALARSLGVSVMVISLTIVAMGTSMPEFVVSVYAAITGATDVTVGNAVGSNIFNLLPTLGIVAMIQPISARSEFIRREIPIVLGVSIASWLFCMPGVLYPPLAGVLFLTMFVYVFLAIHWAKQPATAPHIPAEEIAPVAKEKPGSYTRSAIEIVGGITLLIVASHLFVSGSVWIAQQLGVSELVIGLTLVAAGTSAPELVTCTIAALKQESDFTLGNVMGSNLFNLLGILGCAGLIRGLPISSAVLYRDFPVMIGATLVAWWFAWSGRRISRVEGGCLLAAYIVYSVVLFVLEAGG